MVYQTDEKTNDVMVMLQNKDIEIASLRKRVQFLEEQNKILHHSTSKFWNWFEAMESYTNNWDDMCDCDFEDRNGVHLDTCQTINIRKDVERLSDNGA